MIYRTDITCYAGGVYYVGLIPLDVAVVAGKPEPYVPVKFPDKAARTLAEVWKLGPPRAPFAGFRR
jgi:hypothetical protein